FFNVGKAEKIVYCSAGVELALRDRFASLATLVPLAAIDHPQVVLSDLCSRGVQTLLVEGGSTINTWFLGAGVVDELRLAVAPFFVGDEKAPRFVHGGSFPDARHRRMALQTVETLGDVVVLWYVPEATPSGEADLHWLMQAIDLSRSCPKSDRSFAVGAVLL